MVSCIVWSIIIPTSIVAILTFLGKLGEEKS
jgi:hypothetical protein